MFDKKFDKKNPALYVHIPFCFSKCDYCDFFSVSCKEKIPDSYVDALCKELDFYVQKYQIENLKTVYIGGGTPSLLSSFQIEKLISYILSKSKSKPKEITFEANPESLSLEKLQSLEKSGVNRLSLGIQSFNEKALSAVNRHCSAKIALGALELVKKNWHGTLNLDIIAGLPFLSDDDFLADLQKIVSYNPEHISMYTLTVEEETPLFKKISDGLQFNSDFADSLWLKGFDFLKKNGYFQYEVSNFCKKGFESTHNMIYWKQGDYLGIGSGATGTLWFDDFALRTSEFCLRTDAFVARTGSFADKSDACLQEIGGFSTRSGGFSTRSGSFGTESGGFGEKSSDFADETGSFGAESGGLGVKSGGFGEKSGGFVAETGKVCGLRWTNTKNLDAYIKFWTKDFALSAQTFAEKREGFAEKSATYLARTSTCLRENGGLGEKTDGFYKQNGTQIKIPCEIEKIDLKTREFEYIMMGFRTIYGISFKKYKKLFKNLNPYFGNLENRLKKSSVWNDFVSKNYAYFKKSIFGKNVYATLSSKGLLFLNELLIDLLD